MLWLPNTKYQATASTLERGFVPGIAPFEHAFGIQIGNRDVLFPFSLRKRGRR